MIHIATNFDSNYLGRMLAMYYSACKHIPDVHFWCLCLDDESREILQDLDLPSITLFSTKDLNNSALEATRASRTAGEFAFTSKSNFLAFLVNSDHLKPNTKVLWVDTDVLFFENPKKLLEEDLEKHSIIITSHKFLPEKAYMNARVGRYNAGMVFFRINNESSMCINDWATQCIEWCFHRLESGKIADQMYLDAWPSKYTDAYDLPDKGINLGSWNVYNYTICKIPPDRFIVDNEPLICYHFHGYKFYERAGRLRTYPVCIHNSKIYAAYIPALEKAYATIRTVRPGFSRGLAPKLSLVRYLKQYLQRCFRSGQLIQAMSLKTR